jgi:hypothetical protein
MFLINELNRLLYKECVMKAEKIFLSLLCFTFSFSAYAAASDQEEVETTYSSQDAVNQAQSPLFPAKCKNHVDVIFAAGLAGVHVRDSHIQVAENEVYRLSQTNSYSWAYSAGEAGLGYVFYFVDGPKISSEWRWFPSFEPVLNVVKSNPIIRGTVYPNFILNIPIGLTFKNEVSSTRLMLDADLTIVSKGHFSLYGLFGLGEAWNKLSYRGAGNPTFPSASLNQSSQTNLAWEIGAGLACALNEKFSLSLEYRYTDLGRVHNSSTGTVTNVTTPQLLGPQFYLYTQTALLGLHVAL